MSMAYHPEQETPVAPELAAAVMDVPRLSQFGGLWSIYEPSFHEQIGRLHRMGLANHVAAVRGRAIEDAPLYELAPGAENVAIVSLIGPITKYGSSLTVGVVRMRQALRAVGNAEGVDAVVLMVDSPGGSTAGIDDLAAEVRKLAATKPVVAYIEDLGASAAYYVASQASEIVANAGALVGSIGVYTVVEDWSAFFAREGVKVKVVRAGEFKGAGAWGTEVTEAQIAEIQRTVNGINDLFVAAVAGGRKLSKEAASKLADGRIHLAAAAKEQGLIDRVATLDDVIRGLRSSPRSSRGRAASMETDPMSNEGLKTATGTESPPAAGAAVKPAVLAELKAAIVGADAAFLIDSLEKSLTVSQAQTAWIAKQNDLLAQEHKKVEVLEAAAKKPGVDAVGVGRKTNAARDAEADAGEGGDVITQWEALRVAKIKAGKRPDVAMRELVREHRELHEECLKAYNALPLRRVG